MNLDSTTITKGAKSGRGVWLAVFGLLLAVRLGAQDNLRFDHISIEMGLSHTTVHTIFQQENGLVWIGTEDGLNVYDGYSIEVFKNVEGDPTSLSDNAIKAIHQDRKGRFWVGTENGLNQFDPKTRRFKQWHSGNTPALVDDHIRRIAEDAAGQLWLATDNGVIRVRQLEDTTWVADHYMYFDQPQLKNQYPLAHPTVRGLEIDSRNRLWVGTDGGGFYLVEDLDQRQPRWTHFDNTHPVTAGLLPSGRVNSFSEDVYGNIWLGTWGDGIIKLVATESGWRAVKYGHTPGCTNCISYHRVTNLYADGRGNLWVGTYNMGVNRVTIKENSDDVRIDVYVSDKFNAYSLSHNTAYCFYEDQSSDLWIGTWGDGVSKLNYRNNRILLYSQKNGYNFSILNEVWGIATAPNGDWWISAWDGGLARIRPEDRDDRTLNYRRAFSFHRHDPAQPSSLSDDKVTDLLVDREDRLWATTWGDYLNVAPQASNATNPLSFVRIPVEGLSYFIHQDRTGRVWLGTNRGLFWIEGAEQKGLSPNRFRAVKVEGLPSSRIRALAETEAGDFWLGTIDAGLIRVKQSTLAERRVLTDADYQHYRHEVANDHSLASDHTFTVFTDSEDEIWVGTSRGLSRWLAEEGRFRTYNSRDGLLNNDMVMGIEEDSQGYLWITTERGLVKLSPDEGHSIIWEAYDGLQGHIFTAGAVGKDIHGHLLFGGRDGLNVIDPALMIPTRKVPAMLITDITANNESLLPWPVNAAQKSGDAIELRYFQNLLTFEFAALSYVAHHENMYQYRLLGFEDSWQTLPNKNAVTYTNLDPGEYTFEVKCANSDGVWSETPQRIQIIIHPPVWATVWFRVLMGVLIVGGITGYVWARIKGAERKNKVLESVVAERTREIQRQKQLVEERSRFKEQFFSNVSHELRTPLNGIIGLSYLLQRTPLSQQQRQYSHVIKDSAEHLLAIINDLLDISKLNIGKLQLRPATFEVSRVMEGLNTLMRGLATQKGIGFRWEMDRQLPAYLVGDVVRLHQIMINLIGNAIKFTEQGEVAVRVAVATIDTQQTWLRFIVRDTGIGIPADKLQNIFQSYEQVIDNKGYHYEGTGLGLTIVANLVELLGGEIEVESQVGHGSTFAVRLPFTHASTDEIRQFQADKPPVATDSEWRNKHVLLLEDNPVNTLYAENLLHTWGIQVTQALSIAEARRRLQEATYDGIISDAMLPDGNGLELMAELQHDTTQRNARTPIIALSAANSSTLVPDGLALEASLSKPFSPQALHEALRRMWLTASPAITADASYFVGLSELMRGDPQRMQSFVELVREQVAPAVEAIGSAIAAQAWSEVNYQAHTLKSSLRTIGLRDLATLLQSLEDTAAQTPVAATQIEALLAQFEKDWTAQLPQLEAALEAIAKS